MIRSRRSTLFHNYSAQEKIEYIIYKDIAKPLTSLTRNSLVLKVWTAWTENKQNKYMKEENGMRFNSFKTEILGWKGDIPIFQCFQWDDSTWFFFCPECKKFHYHKQSSGLVVAKCRKGKYQHTGYHLSRADLPV